MEKILSWLIDFVFILLSIIFLVLASLSHNNFKYDTSIINEYKNNWELGPISDIVTVSINEKCPINYQSLITNKFPGNKEGCDCRNSEYSEEKKILYDFPCTPKKLVSKCKSIYKQDDIDLNIWKGKKLCAMRLSKNFWELEEINNSPNNIFIKSYKTNFLENKSENKILNKILNRISNQKILKMQNSKIKNHLMKIKNNNSINIQCNDPDNYKPCGYLDETKNILCIKKSESCPINDILIMKESEFRKEIPIKANYNTINLNDEYNLYFTNKKTDGRVYVEIIAHINDHYCIHPHEGILGQNNYILNNLQGEKNCVTLINSKAKDTRYKLLDSYNMDDFYLENKVNKLIFSKIPDYNFKRSSMEINSNNEEFIYKQTNEKNKISILTSDYLGWKKTCFNYNKNNNNYINSLLDTQQNDVEDIKVLINWIKIICGFNLIYQIFVLIIIKIFLFNFKLNFRTLFFFDLINFILIFTVFILSVLSHKNTVKILQPSYDFIHNKCGDDITNDVFGFTFEKITKIDRLLLAMEITVCLQLFIYLILYGFIFRDDLCSCDRSKDNILRDSDVEY